MAIRSKTPDRIMQLGLGFWGSKTLLTAVELGLFTELAKKPLDAVALTKRLELHPRSARDFFDALVALGMLKRAGARYANTAETALFLDRAKPSYVGGMLEMCNARLYGFFLKAMTGLSQGTARAIAQKFSWKSYRSFADIGCAQGGVAVEIALAQKHVTGEGMDLPVVRPVFEAYVRASKVDKRLAFHAGDFFKDPLPRTDVLIMGHILHDWNLDEKMMLLEKAYAALPPGGALIVHEALIDDARKHNAFGLLMSLNMLIETHGGFDFTGADCRRWMKQVGFKRTKVEKLAGPDAMVIGIK
ncbi:MAG: O-methyltransferase, family 2 [Nitrospira sp.]|nr:O-methyltransferase, family 2 [Nitrospira sp.]